MSVSVSRCQCDSKRGRFTNFVDSNRSLNEFIHSKECLHSLLSIAYEIQSEGTDSLSIRFSDRCSTITDHTSRHLSSANRMYDLCCDLCYDLGSDLRSVLRDSPLHQSRYPSEKNTFMSLLTSHNAKCSAVLQLLNLRTKISNIKWN